MKALVTGGDGFIGSHLVDRLIYEGFKVTVIDNDSTGRPENLSQHAHDPRLEVHSRDIREFDQIKSLFYGAEWVFHLAALADIIPSIVTPLDYYSTNVVGTAHVLEASRLAGVKKIIYAASSSCYGIPDEFPTKEDAAICSEYPYALTKYLGEQTLLHWGKVYKMPVISLRLFNVYGPRARTSGAYGALFGVFLAQKIHGMPFTVVGDGEQTRDFTFVSDVVRALILAADSDRSQEIFNVGSGGTYSINTIADLLGGQRVFIPKRPGEPDCTFADISKIKAQLGWSPKVGLEEGVQILLDQIEAWRSAPVWTEESIAEATRDWFKYLAKD